MHEAAPNTNRPRYAHPAPVAAPPLLSVFDLSRQARVLTDEADRPGSAASGSDAKFRWQISTDRADALKDLLMAMPAVTQADAVAQLCVASDVVARALDFDQSSADRKVGLGKVNRGLLSLVAIKGKQEAACKGAAMADEGRILVERMSP